MEEIIATLAGILPLKEMLMKPDKGIPAWLRILRWGVTVLVRAYGFLLVAEKAKSVFF